ncbi:MAG: hypothetical protein QNJ40_19555 [Xanthomonadales bacterium]|nr:hypothetical protein [Xanthomonadales bacterium]
MYQGQQWLCWAAALQSWAKAVYGENVAQKILCDQMQAAGMLDQRKGLHPSALRWIVETFMMHCYPPIELAWKRMLPTSSLSEGLLKPLMGSGQVMLITANAGRIGHCCVVYGVDGSTLFYMDPIVKAQYQVGKNTSLGSHFAALYARNARGKSRWNMMLQPSFL